MRTFNVTHHAVHYFRFLLFTPSLLHDLLDEYKIDNIVRCTVGEDILVELQLGICVRSCNDRPSHSIGTAHTTAIQLTNRQ
jgi:hypothetical protein